MFWMVVAILAGAALGGGAAENEYGAYLGAVVGWLFVRTLRQGTRIGELEKRLQAAGADAVPPPVQAAAPVDPAPPAQQSPAAAVVPAPPPDDFFDAPAAAPAPAVAPAAAPPRDRLAPVKAWLFGGNTIVKAGVAILFLGLAFLAKYAGEHVQVPVELRLAGIGGVALVLLALGWRLRERRAGYAQVLQGGAIAVLYLTLFVAFRYHGVLAAGPVFALMVAVAVLAAALAVLQDARALAVFGALGGFMTPLIVSTGSDNHVGLFAYYLVLDLGIAAVAWSRTWRLLNLVGFACTFVVAAAWGVLRYDRTDYASSQAFLIAYFVLFVVILLLPARQPVARRGDAWVHGSLLFGLPTVVFALQYGLVRDTAHGVAVSALVLAAFYVALAAWLRRRADLALVFEASLAIGCVFLTLVIPFALDARSTAGAWALEGAGLVWLGWRQQRRLARAFGYGLALLGGAALLWAGDHGPAPEGVFNAMFFNAVLVGAAALASARFVHRAAADAPERLAEPLLVGWGTLWLLATVGIEVGALAPPGGGVPGWIGGASVLALLYAVLAARARWPALALPVAAQAPFMALCLLPMTFWLVNPLQHGGGWAWPLALAAHLAAIRLAAPHWPAPVRHAVHALGVLVLAGFGALLGRLATAALGAPGSAWPWLGWLAAPALVLWLLPLPALRARWPFAAEPRAYGLTACAVLAAGLLWWSLVANVDSTGAARPLPYVPLVNPLDLGVGAALVAVWRWWRGEGAAPLAARASALAPALLGTAAFVWVNAMLLRSFHHHAGVPYALDAWSSSSSVQTGLTLLWTVIALALMWLATRRLSRPVWVVGAVLLAAVVLKLLLVDQSGSGTVARIVSFIGVGVLMLVIGYVAPLPSRRKEQAVAS